MPLILIARFFLSLFSLLLLALAAYLLWTWYEGDLVADAQGVLYQVRDDWRLWTGIAVLAWSFGGGGLIVRPFLAKGDSDKLQPAYGDGEMIAGAQGATLYVESLGPVSAPVIILTHGWGMDNTIWAYAKRDLSRDYRVVVWDLPGMGRSKAPIDAVSLESFADNLALVIRHTGADKVVLVGHSIGGMTTQTLARDHRELFARSVSGAVLVNTTYQNPLTTMIVAKLAVALRYPLIEPMMHLTLWLSALAQLGAWKSYLDGSAHIANRLGFGAYVTHSQLDYTTLLSIRNSQGHQAKGNLAMFRWNALGALAGLPVPVLAIGGKADLLTLLQASETISSSTSAGRLMIVDKVNHMGFLERADIYNEAIADFAATVSEGAPQATLHKRAIA